MHPLNMACVWKGYTKCTFRGMDSGEMPPRRNPQFPEPLGIRTLGPIYQDEVPVMFRSPPVRGNGCGLYTPHRRGRTGRALRLPCPENLGV